MLSTEFLSLLIVFDEYVTIPMLDPGTGSKVGGLRHGAAGYGRPCTVDTSPPVSWSDNEAQGKY